MFYNTGIATYIWVLSNRKPDRRRGKVQLIDATNWFQPLRKNLGKKNCQFSNEDSQRIMQTFLDFKETEQSKTFPNETFGYWKIIVERPLRLHSQFTKKAIETLRFASSDEDLRRELFLRFGQTLYENFGKVRPEMETILSAPAKTGESEDEEEGEAKKPAISEKRRKKLLDGTTWERDRRLLDSARLLAQKMDNKLFGDHNIFRSQFDNTTKELGIKLSASDRKAIINAVSWRVETATPVIASIHKPGKIEADPLHGRYAVTLEGKPAVIEYETDSELRDTEQVPLLEKGGIEAFFRREVLPYVSDAWISEQTAKVGYEISFTRVFYKPEPLRALNVIRRDIEALEKESAGLLAEIINK